MDHEILVEMKATGEKKWINKDLFSPEIHIEIDQDDEPDQFLSDAEADADALASAGWGTDEDYGAY